MRSIVPNMGLRFGSMRPHRRRIAHNLIMSRLWAVCLIGAVVPASAQSTRAAVDFRRDIEPILKASCVTCHTGPKAGGQLRLDSNAAAMRGGISGPVIVPGKS